MANEKSTSIRLLLMKCWIYCFIAVSVQRRRLEVNSFMVGNVGKQYWDQRHRLKPSVNGAETQSDLFSSLEENNQNQNQNQNQNHNHHRGETDRRSFGRQSLSAVLLSIPLTSTSTSASADDFTSLAERAAQISKALDARDQENIAGSGAANTGDENDKRTAYDFSLPVAGDQVTFGDLIRQEFVTILPAEDVGGGNATVVAPTKTEAKVKAILVVNIKQDDPIARKNIPELLSLAAKYGPQGFAVVCLPTDQGYFEPDTSQLIRLKMRQEYGYGLNPATTLTDKVNLLGTGAHPFMKWIEDKCRTPSGLGKIQGNFEKFLVDGQTGMPVRRYPRKYEPVNIALDIDALVNGIPLPPPVATFKEYWRTAEVDAERDLYRFQKGLNVFDQ